MADYFSHDYGARNDPKLIGLQMEMGLEAIGIFWCLIEMMYEQDGYLLLSQCERYAFAMRTDCEKVRRVINNFDLFENDSVNFWNISVLKRLEQRKEKSSRAKDSINSRWKYERNTTKKQTYNDRNTIKESKVKESKEKEIKEKIQVPSHLVEIWPDFLEMRNRIKKPATERAQLNIFAELETLAPQNPVKQVSIVEQSITNSWQGVFQLKDKSSIVDNRRAFGRQDLSMDELRDQANSINLSERTSFFGEITPLLK